MKYYKYLRILMWLIPIGLLSYICYLQLAPNSQLTLRCTDHQCSSGLKIIQRDDNEIVYQVNTYRQYQTAWLTLDYAAAEKSNLKLEIGQKKKPIYNYLLQGLTWPYLENTQVGLWQKQSQYQSVDDFLQNLPADLSQVAVLNYNLADYFKIADYQPTQTKNINEQDLLGSYNFYTYLGREDLNFKFNFLDRDPGYHDPLKIIVKKYGGSLVYSKDYTEAEFLNPAGVELRIPSLTEGVYNIDVITTANIITDSFQTSQQYLMFNKSLFLGDIHQRNQRTISISGSRADFSTTSSAGFQQIKSAGQIIEINQVDYNFHQDFTSRNGNNLEINQGNFKIATDGYIVLQPTHYFDLWQFAKLKQLPKLTDLDNIEYVLADYSIADRIRDGDSYTQSLLLTAADLLTSKKNYDLRIECHQNCKDFKLNKLKIKFSDPQ